MDKNLEDLLTMLEGKNERGQELKHAQYKSLHVDVELLLDFMLNYR